MAASAGYHFVPLPETVHREPRPQARFDRRVEGTGRLTLQLTYRAGQPIHVGAGKWSVDGRTAVRVAVRSGARPVIPGSSMKGVLRARHEAITNSCCLGRAPRGQRLTQTLPSQTFPGYEVVFEEKVRSHPMFSSCRAKSGLLCATCALFGVMSLRGRVAVHDLLAPEGTRFEIARLPERFSPRPHHLGHFEVDEHRQQLTVTKLRGRKFYRGALSASGGPKKEAVEVIPAGTELTGKIVCTNVTGAELGGLLSALGFVPASKLRIGAGKAYPFGRLDPAHVGVVPGPHDDDLPDGFLEGARAEFENSADRHELGEAWLVSISGEAS